MPKPKFRNRIIIEQDETGGWKCTAEIIRDTKDCMKRQSKMMTTVFGAASFAFNYGEQELNQMLADEKEFG